jgi:hypothetical protein
MAAAQIGGGWDALLADLARARAEIAAAAPDAETAAEGEAYLARLLATGLEGGFLAHETVRGGLNWPSARIGGANPDYRIAQARIDPAATYELRGRLNDAERVAVGLYTLDAASALIIDDYTAFDRRTTPDGDFALTIGPDAQGPGALRSAAGTSVLLIRELARAGARTPAEAALSPAAPAPMAASAAPMAAVGQRLLANLRHFILWSRLIGETPNRFIGPPPAIAASVQGDADTHYYFAYYRLEPGQALVVDAPTQACAYWSFQATNHWLEPLPGASLHDKSVKAEADGTARIRIACGAGAGLANVIDTLGRRRGVVLHRTVGAREMLIPTARVETVAG